MPTVDKPSQTTIAGFQHVNLMTDTLIANLPDTELRAVIRNLLAMSPPSMADRLGEAARSRFSRINAMLVPTPSTLFAPPPGSTGTGSDGSDYDADSEYGCWVLTAELHAVLHRARALYGAGMGLEALRVLTAVVAGAAHARWTADSRLEDLLSYVDADIVQARVSADQQIAAARVAERVDPMEVRRELLAELDACEREVRAWGGDFPFDRAYRMVESWKL